MSSFSLFSALPEEIQYQVLDSCSSQTLVAVSSTSRKLNSITGQVLSSRLSALCGLPTSAQIGKSGSATAQISQGPLAFVLKAYSPEDLSHTSVHWFGTEYCENNHFSDFDCNFAHAYCSQPSTAHNSDKDMNASQPSQKRRPGMARRKKCPRDLIPQSKFTVKSLIKSSTYGTRSPRRSHSRLPDLLAIGQQQQHELQLQQQIQLQLQQNQLPQEQHFSNHQVATLDILEGDAFGQLVIELSATPVSSFLTNTVQILQKTHRIYPAWALDHEYAVHNRELTLHLQVIKANGSTPLRNEFGENFDRFHIIVTDIVVNMAYLLHQLEKTLLIA
jgi:hypothetical protein